ncbi:hypothetical protein [Phaeobacter sp. JL2872]|jgi:hypothetical protein|uniref:hypothetical protein n=1 Tax=Phaeobacter sp. JL2872 TaxID=2461377 RepID=UPI0014023637|nr:hypothetical protein [Phaeobacter sp. JL2872]
MSAIEILEILLWREEALKDKPTRSDGFFKGDMDDDIAHPIMFRALSSSLALAQRPSGTTACRGRASYGRQPAAQGQGVSP